LIRGEDARRCAYRVLIDYNLSDTYLNILLASSLAGSGLGRRDRALITELVQGTVRMKLTLDWAIGQFSNRGLGSLDPRILWILRMSAYQVMFTSVPDYAACDEAVNLTRHTVGEAAVGYVNGVLRALARGLDRIEWPDREREPVQYIEVRHSHPRWVVEMWLKELGPEKAESLCVADNIPPLLSIRCNLLRTTREELAAALVAQDFEVELGGLAPEALLVKGSGPLGELEEYNSGLFAVQDQGSILVGHLVDPRPGMRVLDMCAAPGGKANHLAELMQGIGSVVAMDVNRRRLLLVEETALRLGNAMVNTVEFDATEAKQAVDGMFDRVLIDAPCTGLGTLARRPDVRWRKVPDDVERLSVLQRSLLTEGGKMVRPGGLLVYSTCTISRGENEGVVSAFLENHAGFVPVENDTIDLRSGAAPFIQLFPDRDRCDGMFIAVLRRGTQ
jgi:16S rRNA (cytosine967-C5)-methyltransferase